MKKEDLVNLLNEIFLPLGYQRKDNSWVYKGIEINKVVSLQRSHYSVCYYLNFGVVIHSIKHLTDMKKHVFRGLGSLDKEENTRIKALLDLERDMDIDLPARLIELKELITYQIVNPFSSISAEEDVLDYLKSWPSLSSVPGIVKDHFNLKEDHKEEKNAYLIPDDEDIFKDITFYCSSKLAGFLKRFK